MTHPVPDWREVRPLGCTCDSWYQRDCCAEYCGLEPDPSRGSLLLVFLVPAIIILMGVVGLAVFLGLK